MRQRHTGTVALRRSGNGERRLDSPSCLERERSEHGDVEQRLANSIEKKSAQSLNEPRDAIEGDVHIACISTKVIESDIDGTIFKEDDDARPPHIGVPVFRRDNEPMPA